MYPGHFFLKCCLSRNCVFLTLHSVIILFRTSKLPENLIIKQPKRALMRAMRLLQLHPVTAYNLRKWTHHSKHDQIFKKEKLPSTICRQVSCHFCASPRPIVCWCPTGNLLLVSQCSLLAIFRLNLRNYPGPSWHGPIGPSYRPRNKVGRDDTGTEYMNYRGSKGAN